MIWVWAWAFRSMMRNPSARSSPSLLPPARICDHGFDMHVAQPVEPAELVAMIASLAARRMS